MPARPHHPLRAALALLACLLPLPAAAQATRSTYIALGPSMPALLHEPAAPGAKARVGFVTIHPFSNYLNHASCENLAARGYRVLCANTPFGNNQYGYGAVERLFPTIRAAVERLRKIPGVEKVVLIGHSAASPMMAYYQNVAQNGAGVCSGPEKLLPCDPALVRDLPRADGLVLLDPHLGDAFATLTYIDPAVADGAAPARRIKELDLYDSSNGYDPQKGGASYSPEFRARFLAAQAARNAQLIAQAQALLVKINAKEPGFLADDMPFEIAGGTAARLFQPDTGLLRQSKRAHKMLKADGTESLEVLVSVRPPSGNARDAQGFRSVLQISVKNFLAARTLRTTADYNQTADDVTGIDWDSSNATTMPNVKGVTVPLLIQVMGAHYFLRPGEMILDASGSADKEMVAVEGATHVFTPCGNCGKPASAFGDTVKRTFDYLDRWAAARF